MEFFFSERIGRLVFLGRYAINLVLVVILEVILKIAASSAQNNPGTSIGVVVVCALMILPLLYYFMRFIVIARLRSIGLSGWYGLLVLVPLLNFVFLLFLLACPADSFGEKGA